MSGFVLCSETAPHFPPLAPDLVGGLRGGHACYQAHAGYEACRA
jgi:hypothetical protein